MSFYKAILPLSSFPSFQSRCHTTCDGLGYYTSPNETSLPPNAGRQTPLSAVPSPQELRRQIWNEDQYPYLPFIFNSPFFGHAMGRFVPLEDRNLEKGSQGWHLPYSQMKSWKTFEQGLRKLGHKLTAALAKACPQISPTWRVPENPSAYGYFECHPSQAAAYNATLRSVDGFVVYSGYVSFLLVLLRLAPNPRTPLSYEAIFQNYITEVHPDWRNNLLESGVGDLSPQRRRVGVIINIRRCSWLNLAPFMMTAQVPIWFYWGQLPIPSLTGSWLVCFVPSLQELLPPLAGTNPTSQSLPLPNANPPLPDSPPFPSTVAHSGQREGESMKDFFMRRALINSELLQKEGSSERSRRLARAEANKTKKPPGKRGARVFRWEEVDGHRIRTPVTRDDAEDWFAYYGAPAIVYDSFRNEFDCCSEFGDESEKKSEEERSECSEDSYVCPVGPWKPSMFQRSLPTSPQSGPPSPQHEPSLPPDLYQPLPSSLHSSSHHPPTDATPGNLPPSTPPSHPIVSEQDMDEPNLFELSREDVVNSFPISSVQAPRPQPYSIEDLMYDRYGYVLEETPYQGVPVHLQCQVQIVFKNWVTACRGVGGQHLEGTSTQNQQPIIDFLNILASAERPWDEVPAKYWDLSPGNAARFETHTSFHFYIEVKYFDHIGALCLLHPRDLDERDHPSWLLAVPPITALECVRRCLGPDPLDTAEYFIRHGMPFRTLRRVRGLPPSHPPQIQSSTTMLGVRPADFSFDRADYASYEILCDSYLLSHGNARAALMAGGIIARIARAVLPDDVVLTGPSQSALNGNQSVLICGGDVYVDDELSVEVKDFICGTYQKGNNMAARYSWYPREMIWENSGFNVGHWNPECEDWFLNRRGKILSGTSTVLSGEEWRKATRMTRGARKVVTKMNDAALAYLESSYSTKFLY